MAVKKAVRAFIRPPDDSGKLLALQRAGDFRCGMFCLPGGKAEDLSPVEAIAKEVQEETGLDFRPDPEPLFTIPPDHSEDSEFETEYYEGEATGDLKLNEESMGYVWAPRETMMVLPFAFETNRAMGLLYIDQLYMAMAISLAEKGRNEDDDVHPCVGAAIVKEGMMISGAARNENQKGSHAEYWAIKKANDKGADLRGATIYTTLEPCVYRNPYHHPDNPLRERHSCTDHIINNGINAVVISMLDPNPRVHNLGYYRLMATGRKTVVGVLEDKVREINDDFIAKYTENR
ncbi:MAG: NUDIX domain-containing protein [Candidatus Woesearchaeota archaeon]